MKPEAAEVLALATARFDRYAVAAKVAGMPAPDPAYRPKVGDDAATAVAKVDAHLATLPVAAAIAATDL